MTEEIETLSRRERQIMDIVYADGRATATEVLERLPDPPSNSAVRALLRVLENKGHLKHVSDGTKYVYLPTLPADRASTSALKRLCETFFEGSTEKAVTALLALSKDEMTPEELDRIARLVDDARKEGR